MIIYKKITNTSIFEKLPQYRIMYSSSLYPYYFTALINKNDNSIVLYNEGTDQDDYEVTFLNRKNTVIYSEKIAGVKAGTKRLFFPGYNLKKKKWVIIKSLNSDAVKKLKI